MFTIIIICLAFLGLSIFIFFKQLRKDQVWQHRFLLLPASLLLIAASLLPIFFVLEMSQSLSSEDEYRFGFIIILVLTLPILILTPLSMIQNLINGYIFWKHRTVVNISSKLTKIYFGNLSLYALFILIKIVSILVDHAVFYFHLITVLLDLIFAIVLVISTKEVKDQILLTLEPESIS
ncbi:hypothetical protein SAMN04488558_10739 [Ignavigranum ruoffiae]|uniref:DUF2975 domain-containing protein n=1 Tax=Ignavigranum ruoffiae TaxID=89093 RepID=A0A1H9EHW8_9LACT|nr:hypothetical protein [Ignavigranum ruoffiae]SEQ25215.1 hypothetical protein SAMN04488558_10739 [Ignavigranum ruoffiae]